MDVRPSLVADAQPAVLVEPGDRALDHPALLAEPGAVLGLAFGDPRLDPSSAQLATVRFGVVAAVAEQRLRPPPWPAALAPHGRNRFQQRQQLGDVVAVGGAEQAAEWDTAAVGDQVVLGAGFAPVYRAGTGFAAPKTART